MTEPNPILSTDEVAEVRNEWGGSVYEGAILRLCRSHEALRAFEAEAIRCRDEAEERADAHASGRRKAEARELAAHDVIRRYRDSWRPGKSMAVVMAGSPRPDPEPIWMSVEYRRDAEPMTDAERAVLDAVAGPDDPRCAYSAETHAYCGRKAEGVWTDGRRQRALCHDHGVYHETWGWELAKPCPGGCGCVTEEDPDRRDCACDGPCCMDENWPVLAGPDDTEENRDA